MTTKELSDSKIDPEVSPVNISSGSKDEAERLLSNLNESPFELDGIQYRSVESFWQGLYFPEDERANIARLDGLTAKRFGGVREGQTHVIYDEKNVRIGSFEHHILLFRALKAKFDQNPTHRHLLLSTKHRELTHFLKKKDGTIIPDSKSIPAVRFTQMLRILREYYGAKK